MADPTIKQAMDPADVERIEFDFTALLAAGEAIASIVSVALNAEATAAGVELGSGPRAPFASNGIVTFWLQVADAQENAAAFTAGVPARVTVTFTTNASPARTLQRTGTILIRQR